MATLARPIFSHGTSDRFTFTHMQRILIVRFSSIGDIVLTSPVIRALRKKFPAADIRFLTKEAYVNIVAANPHLTAVLAFDGNLRKTISEVRAFGPEVIIDLHHNLRTALLKAAVGTRAISFPKLNLEKWLHVNLRLDSLPDIHVVDRYFRAVGPLDVTNDGLGLEFFMPEDVTMPDLPSAFASGFVAVAVGAKFFTKQIPADKLVDIIRGINCPVVLLGGKEDADNGQYISDRTDALDYCGKLTLHQSARLVQAARAVITPDTGMMHIAAALQRPVISVWGNTVPAFGMGPYLPRHPELVHIVEQKGLPCRPCSKIGHARCPKEHFNCMNLLDTDDVVRITRQYL